jgi:hypothetical protein
LEGRARHNFNYIRSAVEAEKEFKNAHRKAGRETKKGCKGSVTEEER